MKTYLEYLTEQIAEDIGLTESANDPFLPEDLYLSYLEAAEGTTKMEVHTTYYLQEHLMPLIEKAMTKRGIDSVIEFTGNFIDSNSKSLMAGCPLYNCVFGDKEQKFFYDLVGLSKPELVAMYEETIKIAYSGDNVNKHSIITNMKTVYHMLIIIGILIWAIRNDEKDLKEACKYLSAFVWYPLIFRHYWPHGVIEGTMVYTLEHMSGKRFIKQHKTMLSYLYYHGDTCYKNFEERLKDGADRYYADYNNRVRNQINSPMRGISNEYYDNHDDDASHHEVAGTYDDGNLADQDSTTTMIGAIADKTFAKFTTIAIDVTIANTVAEGCEVSKAKLNSYLNKLLPLKENELFKLIENVLILFMNSKPADDSVGSGVFLNFGLSLYRSISSAKDPSKQTIARILTMWTNELLKIQEDYPTRPATVIGFRKALFFYIIFMTQRYNS